MKPDSSIVGLAWVSPWLIGGSLFTLLPMGLSLYYSLTDFTLLEKPIWVGLDNYARMLTDPALHKAVINTAIYAVVFIPLATLIALVLAALLKQPVKPSRVEQGYLTFIRACIFIPTLVPMVATAVVFMWLMNGQYGLINQGLKVLGIVGPNWLVDQGWAIPALVLLSLWSVGQQVVVYIAAMNEVPSDLYEAARLDGMGIVRRFVMVTLPMISPVILFNVIVLLIGTLQIFVQPFILFRTKDGQNDAGLFYTMHLYDNAFVYNQMGYASAMAWVQLVLVLILTAGLWFISKKFVHHRGG
jgi:multiple sugar transport system permease protein